MKTKDRRVFLKLWITPAVITVSLPQHAQATPGPIERALDVSLLLDTCDDSGANSIASAILCNNELETIEVYFAGASDFVTVVDPLIPFTVDPGECKMINMEGGPVQQFDCSGNFGMTFAVRILSTGDYDTVTINIKNDPVILTV